MKTRKYNLNAIAMGVALVLGSMSAANAAVPVNPSGPGLLDAISAENAGPNISLSGNTYNITDRGAVCLVESALSLVAANQHYLQDGCSTKSYGLEVESDFSGTGTAFLDDVGANGLVSFSNTVTQSTANPSRGAKCVVDADGQLFGTTVSGYDGNHAWSRFNQFFIDSAVFNLNNVPYDEHSIKDFYGRNNLTGDYTGQKWIFDWGLEVVTKLGYPVSKWSERSWYNKWDGADGKVKVVKQDVATGCKITYIASPYFSGDAVTFSGTVSVSRPQ